MILDAGVCSIYTVVNTADSGEKPVDALVLKGKAWYGILNYGTDSEYVTSERQDVVVDAKIRILQDRRVNVLDVVTLANGKRHDVLRVYHGTDDDSGEPISDLSLRRVEK